MSDRWVVDYEVATLNHYLSLVKSFFSSAVIMYVQSTVLEI